MNEAMELQQAGTSRELLARCIGVPYDELLERENSHARHLGWMEVDGSTMYGVRAHCGQIRESNEPGSPLATFNGGVRLIQAPKELPPGETIQSFTEKAAKDLAGGEGMLGKRTKVGSRKNGGKLVIVTDDDPTTYSFEKLTHIIEVVNDRMNDREIAGHLHEVRSIVAPDMNTGRPGLFDRYALRQLGHGDKYGLASAGSKLENGNEFRGDSTSYTSFLAGLKGRDMTNPDRRHSFKIQGAGNVGLILARFISQDKAERGEVVSMSDQAPHPTDPRRKITRTIAVPEGSGGILVSPELATRILTNPGPDRIATIEEDIDKNQPHIRDKVEVKEGDTAIFEFEADWLYFAAAGNALNARNLPAETREAANKLARLGVFSAANHGVTGAGHAYLVRHGKMNFDDGNVNFGGTACTDIEIRDNLLDADSPWHQYASYEASQAEVTAMADGGWHQVDRVGAEFDGIDMVQASILVGIGQSARWHGLGRTVDSRVARHLVDA